jgi:hypothetical protein
VLDLVYCVRCLCLRQFAHQRTPATLPTPEPTRG